VQISMESGIRRKNKAPAVIKGAASSTQTRIVKTISVTVTLLLCIRQVCLVICVCIKACKFGADIVKVLTLDKF